MFAELSEKVAKTADETFFNSENGLYFVENKDKNSTTAWETIEGGEAFENAGSLCHGWSAVPIYYYHKLLKK